MQKEATEYNLNLLETSCFLLLQNTKKKKKQSSYKTNYEGFISNSLIMTKACVELNYYRICFLVPWLDDFYFQTYFRLKSK